MSSVLIGIIGVILFIGLALAGAIILGDDFRTAGAASQAAALMSQLKQASDAATMWKVRTGAAEIPSIETDFLVPRYLKTPAVNPTSKTATPPSSYWYAPNFVNSLYLDGARERGYAAKYVIAPIGPSTDSGARNVCQSIAETYGGSIVDFGGNGDGTPVQEAGCVIIPGSGTPTGWFTAYQRVGSPTQSYTLPSGYAGP